MPGVDLATPAVWLWFAAAVLVLPPLSGRPRAFVAVLALIDLGFVASMLTSRLAGGAMLLAVDFAAFVLVPLALFWLGLRAVADAARRPAAVAVVVGLGVAALFVLHKRPEVAGAFGDLGPVLGVIGLSYVALRAVDLLVTVAQRRVPAPGPLELVTYLLPFHMLAAGPIAGAEDAHRSPCVAPPDFAGALQAAERIASGLFKKFVVAHALHETFLTGFSADGPYFWLEVQLFYLWVYLDFSAYTDIAVGIGRLVGHPTPENFDRPLTARNLIVFWERWHITLGAFARRNVFVPLQLALARRSPARPLLVGSLALAVAFVAIGLWHGLSAGFLAWGAMHAAGVVVVNLYRAGLVRRLGRKRARAFCERPVVRAVATALTFEFVALSLMLVEVAWKPA